MEDYFENKDCITPIKEISSIKVFGNDCHDDGQKPSFTIAIPTYKRISTLSDAIDSALHQEAFKDYERIVVDNNP